MKQELTNEQRNRFESELYTLLKIYGLNIKPIVTWTLLDKFVLESPDSKTIKTLPSKFKHDYFVLHQKLLNRNI